MVVTPVKLKARPPATDDKAMLAPLDVVSVKRTSRTEELGIVGTEGVVIDIRRHGSDPLYAVVVRGRELPALLGTNDLAATGERAHVVEEPRARPVRKPRDDIRWEAYEIFDPEVDRPLADVSRAEARAHHHRLLAMTDHWISELRKLADSAGIELDGPSWSGTERLTRGTTRISTTGSASTRMRSLEESAISTISSSRCSGGLTSTPERS